jgi:hypothetical protein
LTLGGCRLCVCTKQQREAEHGADSGHTLQPRRKKAPGWEWCRCAAVEARGAEGGECLCSSFGGVLQWSSAPDPNRTSQEQNTIPQPTSSAMSAACHPLVSFTRPSVGTKRGCPPARPPARVMRRGDGVERCVCVCVCVSGWSEVNSICGAVTPGTRQGLAQLPCVWEDRKKRSTRGVLEGATSCDVR